MSRRETEADFQTYVIDLAHLYKWRVAHFRTARTEKGWRTPVSADGKGFPDLVLVRDRVIYAELKSDSGRLSSEQEAWLEDLAAAGAETYVWRPSDRTAVEAALRWRGRDVGTPGMPA